MKYTLLVVALTLLFCAVTNSNMKKGITNEFLMGRWAKTRSISIECDDIVSYATNIETGITDTIVPKDTITLKTTFEFRNDSVRIERDKQAGSKHGCNYGKLDVFYWAPYFLKGDSLFVSTIGTMLPGNDVNTYEKYWVGRIDDNTICIKGDVTIDTLVRCLGSDFRN